RVWQITSGSRTPTHGTDPRERPGASERESTVRSNVRFDGLRICSSSSRPLRYSALPVQQAWLLTMQPFLRREDSLHTDAFRSSIHHVIHRVSPGLEVRRIPVDLVRGLVLKDLEKIEPTWLVGVFQHMKLKTSWLVSHCTLCLDECCLRECVDILRLNVDRHEDRVHVGLLIQGGKIAF